MDQHAHGEADPTAVLPQLREVLLRLPAGVLLLAADGEVLFANAAAEQFLAALDGGRGQGFAAGPLGAQIRAVGMAEARSTGRWVSSVPLPDPTRHVDLEVLLYPTPENPAEGGGITYGLVLTPVPESTATADRARLLAAVIEQSTEFVAYHGPIGAEARVNPAAAALVGGGVQADEPLGVRIRDLFVPDSQALIQAEGVAEMERTGSWRAGLRVRNADTGEVRDLDWSMFMVRSPDGRVLGTAGMGRDVTDRARTEAELRATHAELSQLYERTRQLGEAKNSFFAKVSHELRTPLTLILAPVERLLGSLPAEDPARGELAVVERNGRVLLRQVNNLLDAAKLEAGGLVVDYAEVDLAHQVRAVAGFFESAAVDRGVSLVVQAPARTPAQLDPEHLHSIVGNLLSNALKATPAGGTIRCELSAVQDRAVLSVADSGPGIPAEHRSAVFERFRQVGDRQGELSGEAGTGLGLSIVRDLAQLHGGEVSAGAAPEGGALVTVTLPLQAPAGARVAPTAPGPSAAVWTRRASEQPPDEAEGDEAQRTGAGVDPVADAPPGDRRPLILIVEDNRDLNRLISSAMGEHYRMASAYDGTEGIELIRKLRPALVVCDVMMPKQSGTDLLRVVRADPEIATLPVLVVSARADDGARLALFAAGASDYITKPFSVHELRVRVDNLLHSADAQDRLRLVQVALDRERIANDLHERVIGDLFNLSLRLGGVCDEAPGRVGDRIDEVMRGMDRVVREIRATIFQTQP